METNKKCDHYNRNCLLLSPCCNKIYECRICHDIEMYDNELDINKQHKMINSEVKIMICKQCNTQQNFSKYCEKCNLCMGNYFCEICKFVDNNDNQKYFHCQECGICRRGDQSEYKHCNTCNRCFGLGHFDNDKYEHKQFNDKCPICFDELFDSIYNCCPMNCGHMIHTKCLDEYIKSNLQCPLCCKSIINIDNEQLLKYKNSIESHPIPDDYKDKKVNILCNDCNIKSNVNWHYISMFCPHCNSFNTKEII